MKAKCFTKLVAWLLCVLMIAACLPAAALAAWESDLDLNPFALTTGDNGVTVAFAEQGAAASFSAAPGIYEISLALPEGSDAGMASMKVNGTEKLDGETLNVTVANPDEIIDITEIYVYDADVQHTTGKVIINVVLLVEGNGTAEYPYAIGGSDEDGNLIETATITVPAGQTVYYSSIYADYTMTIYGENGFVVEQGGVQYEDENGKASIVIPESVMQGSPALLSVTNNTESEQTYDVYYTLVETDTTERLTLGVEATHSFIENDEYYSYKYIAEKDGELLIHISSTTGWQLVVNEEDMYYSDVDSESVPFSYTVATGDEILITVLTQDDENPWGDLPAGDVTVKVEYKQEVVFPTGSATLEINGKSVTFASNLTMSFYVLPDVYEQYENVYVEIKKGESSDVLTLTEHSWIDPYDNARAYDFEGISPYKLDEEIQVTIYGTYQGVQNSSTMITSAKEYCQSRLEKTSDSTFKTLLVDLLNYATASQEYERSCGTSGISETLINSFLTEEQKGFASTYVDATNQRNDAYTVIENATAFHTANNIRLTNAIELTFSFTCEDMEGVTAKVKVADQEWEITEFSYDDYYGEYYFDFSDLLAYQLREPVYVTIYKNGQAISNTKCYSVTSYIYSRLQKSTDPLFIALVKNLQCYGDSAYAYFYK